MIEKRNFYRVSFVIYSRFIYGGLYMKIKSLIVFIVFISVLAILFTGWNGFGNASLVASQSGSKEIENFILHIRIEEVNEEITVFRSLQYIGDGSVEIEHQTPLISISLSRKNHDFTGSTVKEVMKSGDSYYPQKAKIMKVPKKGEYILYCLAEFQVDGKIKKIEHTEELTFE